MRAGLALLALATATPAMAGVPWAGGGSANSPVRTQPLAPGELLLETGGIALTSVPADRATFGVEVQAGGATSAEARAAARAQLARVVEAARRAGVPEASIDLTPDATVPIQTLAIAEPDASHPETAVELVVIRDLDIARLEPVRAALRATGIGRIAEPTYSLADPGVARRRASTQAFARARADAEDYAAALNMRVVRMVRITERVGMDMISILMSHAAELPQSPPQFDQPQTDPEIPALALVGVDFALGPR